MGKHNLIPVINVDKKVLKFSVRFRMDTIQSDMGTFVFL